MEDAEAESLPKKSKAGLVLGLVLALFGGGAGFAVTSGMIELPEPEREGYGADLVFIPMDALTVSIGKPPTRRFLRFRAELEVEYKYHADVKKMMPRVVDVLNTYLRSLSVADIESPSSLLTLRAQMRRRIDLVVGGDRVNDLLVMEFVVN